MSIGLRIKKNRIDLGLSAKTLSNQIGVSRSYLTLIENGERHLPKKMVGKLAQALRVPKETVYEWYLDQKLAEVGIRDKKSQHLIKVVLNMTIKRKRKSFDNT